MLCRQLPHPDRQRHPREQSDESSERDDVRCRVQAELGDRGSAEARRYTRGRRDDRLRVRGRTGSDAQCTDGQSDDAPGDELSPAATQHRRDCRAGKAVGRQPHEPRTRERMSLDLRQLRKGRGGRPFAAEYVLHQAVQLRDPVEIDGRRPYADREAPLCRQRPDRELDQCRVAETCAPRTPSALASVSRRSSSSAVG